ncbi:MAG: glycerol-3-phosphate acyltransferase, partial [Nitrospirae bacterium]|nr:glycerol-3-phosphate acyltransferase [Nitrospirota bacterium]
MNDYTIRITFIAGAYLLGAVPFGLLTAKAMGAGDIRKMGSGNIGATNVLRNAGKLGGFITLLLDSLKGVIPVLIAKAWWGTETWTLGVALAAVLGHNYPVYLKFKGGKGVATSLGILVALWSYVGLI